VLADVICIFRVRLERDFRRAEGAPLDVCQERYE
jgi:hypothetical protein